MENVFGANDHKQPVRAALRELDSLSSIMLDDLSPRIGGIGWWYTYGLPEQVRRLLSDYIVTLPRAIRANLGDAAAHAALYHRERYMDDIWTISRIVQAGGLAGSPNLIGRSELDSLRDAAISCHVAGFFRAAGSSWTP